MPIDGHEQNFNKIINHIANSTDNDEFECNMNDIIKTDINRINAYPTRSLFNSGLKRINNPICFDDYNNNIIAHLMKTYEADIEDRIKNKLKKFDLRPYMRFILQEIFNKYKIKNTDEKGEISKGKGDKITYWKTNILEKKNEKIRGYDAVIDDINSGENTYNITYTEPSVLGVTKIHVKNVQSGDISKITPGRGCEKLFLEKFFTTRNIDVFTSYVALICNEVSSNIEIYNEYKDILVEYNNFIMNTGNDNPLIKKEDNTENEKITVELSNENNQATVESKIKKIIGHIKHFQIAIRKALNTYDSATKNNITILGNKKNVSGDNEENVSGLQKFHANIYEYINHSICEASSNSNNNNNGGKSKRKTKFTRKNKIAVRRSRRQKYHKK